MLNSKVFTNYQICRIIFYCLRLPGHLQLYEILCDLRRFHKLEVIIDDFV